MILHLLFQRYFGFTASNPKFKDFLTKNTKNQLKLSIRCFEGKNYFKFKNNASGLLKTWTTEWSCNKILCQKEKEWDKLLYWCWYCSIFDHFIFCSSLDQTWRQDGLWRYPLPNNTISQEWDTFRKIFCFWDCLFGWFGWFGWFDLFLASAQKFTW